MNIPTSCRISSFPLWEYASVSDQLNCFHSALLRPTAISNESKDSKGNLCRLWALPNNTFFGTVTHPDGNISVIPSNKIDVPSSQNTLQTLNRLKNKRGLFLDIIYIPEQQKLVVFPHLRAAGKEDQIAQIFENTICPKNDDWVPPKLDESSSVLGHIFRKNSSGHFAEDSPENRAYILAAVSDPRNKVGAKKSGTEIYYKRMPDGYLAWAHVDKGVVKNGGRVSPWARWKAIPDSDTGGRTAYFKLDNDLSVLKEQVQIDRLTDVYNSTVKYDPWKPHPLESRGITRDVGGVRHQIGIILDVLEELKSSRYDDHVFYIPITEDNPLEKEEVLRIAQEVARGIYLYDAIPFFSLNMNPQYHNYSIVHPAYQNTYVGYVISMLDYYLKGFWTGQLFKETFIKQWGNSSTTDEKVLKDHTVSIEELSDLSDKEYFRNFDQILDDLIKEVSFTPEQLANWRKISENLLFSCKIISKQNSIQKYENIFVPDGEIELIYDVEWKPEGKDQEVCYEILDHACKILCEQIRLVGFRLPQMQKWLSALKVMNFFCSYFRTLQEAEKIPMFSICIPTDEDKVCPSVFPPIPYPRQSCIEFEAEALIQTLSPEQKKSLLEYCQKDSENDAVFQNMKSLLIDKIESQPMEGGAHLSQGNIESLIEAILNLLRSSYRTIDGHLEKFLIDMKITNSSYHSQTAWIIRSKINAIEYGTTRAISDLKSKIASKKIYEDEDNDILESLKGIEKALEESSKWIDDPLGVLVEKETWSYDIERKRLTSVQKTPSGEVIKVFGGYEPSVHDMISEESSIGRKILEHCREKSIELEYERVLSLDPEQMDCPSGLLFALPIEDSFPLSTYGIPYDAIQLFPSNMNNISDQVFYTLLQAIREEDEEAFAKFQAKDMDCSRLDIFGRGALHYAAVASSPRFLQTFIGQQVDLSFPDSSGCTALHHAAHAGRLYAIELLTADKKLINITALKGETPVYLAVNNNQILAVEKLIAANADLSLKPSHGYNVLMSAIHNGHEDMALSLIQTGKVDANYTWRLGKTVLHFAIEMQMEKVLEALLRNGMDRYLPYLGKKPIVLAQEQKWDKGVEILRTNFVYKEAWCVIL